MPNCLLSRQGSNQRLSLFWEFIAGPLNVGSFGPNRTDATFGLQVVFTKTPPAGKANLSLYAGLQFFGEVNIDNKSRAVTVDLKDINGAVIFSKTLPAEPEHDRD